MCIRDRVDFLRDKEEWAGTATELLAAMRETETLPTVITKWLNEYRTTFLNENHIVYQYSRKKHGRQISQMFIRDSSSLMEVCSSSTSVSSS